MNERDMDNFDKLFSEKLNEVPNFPNEDENWQKVALRVDALEKDGSSAMAWWWWLPLCLLLLGWNGWQTWTIRQMGHDNAQMKSIIQNFENRFFIKSDTIIENRTIIKNDTIYHHIHVFEKPISGSRFTNNVYSNMASEKDYQDGMPISTSFNTTVLKDVEKNRGITTLSVFEPNSKEINTNINKINTIQKIDNQGIIKNNTLLNNKINSEKIEQKGDTSNTAPSSNSAIIVKDTSTFNRIALTNTSEQNTSPKSTSTKDTTQQKENPSDTTAAVQKETAQVAVDSFEKKLSQLNETYQKPMTKKMPKITVKDMKGVLQGSYSDLLPHRENTNWGKWWGIGMDIGLHQRFSVTADINRSNTHFTLYEYPSRAEPYNLPTAPLINNDYQLKYIEGSLKSWQLGIGGNYFFTKMKMLKPYISMGYLYRIVVPTDMEFEYQNKATGEDRSFKVKNDANHIDHLWRAGLGIEGMIYHKIGAKLTASYLLDTDKSDVVRLKYWLLSGGVFFKLRQ